MPKSYQMSAIGAVIVAAVLLVSWFLFSIHPNVGDGKNQIRVRFANVEKIAGGTRVTFAGRPVGEVIAIRLLPEARKVESKEGEIYPYEVTLKLDSVVSVYPTDEVSLKTSGLMGEKTIAITPRRLDTNEEPLPFNSVLFATSSSSVDETMASVSNMTKKLEKTIDQMNELQNQFSKTLDSITHTSDEVGILAKQINDENLAGALHNLINKVSNGDGSLAQFISKDDFYLKTTGVMNKVDTLMNDFNSYGPLFHLDKTWQRDRRKRIEEMARLEKPAQFKEFLNEELQKITISCARFNMALDKADKNLDPPAKEQLTRSLTDLMQNIDALNDTVKLYAEMQTAEVEKK